MDKLAEKYYEVYITGVPKVDEKNVPVTKEDGTPEVSWQRITNPDAKARAVFGAGRFYQTEMVEVNLGEDIKTSAGGKVFEIGPKAMRGKTVPCFETRHREPFKWYTQRIVDGKIDIVVPWTTRTLANGKTFTYCVGKLRNFAQPGYWLEQETGFDYWLFQRNPITHITEKVMTNKYDKKGNLVPTGTIRKTVDIFLFPNELDAADAHIKTAIEACVDFKFKPEAGANERAEEVLGDAKPGTTSKEEIPTV